MTTKLAWSPKPAALILVGVDELPPSWDPVSTHEFGLMGPETQPNLPPPPSWSAIPMDLAVLVLGLLPAYADRARFAAVCPQWRAAARQILPKPLPLLALPDGTFYSLPYTKPFRFPGCGFAEYKSVCGSWLVFPRDDGCFLVDPFSRATVRLPALSRIRLQPPNAVARWSHEDGEKIPDPYTTWMHMKDSDKLHIMKRLYRGLCSLAYNECKVFEDMVFYQGKLYALSEDEDLLVVDINQEQSTGDPQVSRIRRVIEGDPWYSTLYDEEGTATKKLYLVESRGTLLMVRRKVRVCVNESYHAVFGDNEFEVFRADFEHLHWFDLTTVGDDQVLFLGRRCSRAVSVSHYGLSGDHIFFSDDDDENYVEYGYEEENTSCSAYDMRFGEVSSPYPMISWKRCDEMRLATWLFPQD